MTLIIGLTGPLGAGKSSVAKQLSALACARDLEVACYSLSDEIRSEVRRRGLSVQRESLKQTADAVRSTEGNGVWAVRVSAKVDEYLTTHDSPRTLVLVDAIRNPGEVEALRSHFGCHFRLLAVTASPEVIGGNLRRRGRKDESESALKDEGVLRQMIQMELGAGEPGFGHNVTACIAMSDWPPLHNAGTLDDLQTSVRALAEHHIFPMFSARDL